MMDKMARRFWVILTGAVHFLVASGIAFASGHSTTNSVRRGQELFQQKCVGCHHKQVGDTTPFGPPNLHGIFQQKAITPSDASEIIRHGRGTMPAFGTLDDKQIQELLAYLKER
jgi:mono/diheme cytochrome c family protein